jgi:hypothetical protein
MVAPRTPGGATTPAKQGIFVSNDYLSKVAPSARYSGQYGIKNNVQGAYLTQDQWKQLQGGTNTFAQSVIGTKAKQPKPPKPPKTKKPAGKAMTLPATTQSPMAPMAPVQAGVPAAVRTAASRFLAGLAGTAQQFRQRDISRRNVLSAGLTGAGQMAADIYGGRSPAILGQAITGQQRQALQSNVANLQARTADEMALAQMFAETSGLGYSGASQNALEDAKRRAEMINQIKAVGA